MNLQVTGKIHKIFDAEKKTESFTAQEFILEIEDGKYPQLVKFQLVQERVGLVDRCKEGDRIDVHFDLRGREWQDKFFTNLNCWKVETVEPAPADNGHTKADASFPDAETVTVPTANGSKQATTTDGDDLPF